MVAKTKDRFLIERYAQAEASSFRNFLMQESPDNVDVLTKDFGFDIEKGLITFTDYLIYLPRDEAYKLVNAPLKNGKVQVHKDSIANLLPEKLRSDLRRDLRKDIDVPPIFNTYATEISKEVSREKAFRTKENFGAVEVELFPPCIDELIQDAQSGDPMAHQP